MKKISCFIVLFILFLLVALPSVAFSTPQYDFPVKRGQLNFQDTKFPERKISLEGQWEFYWGKLLQPGDFLNFQGPQYIEVPGIWSSDTYTGNEELKNEGFGTYRLHIKIDKEDIDRIFSLYIPPVASSFQLWVDGKPVAKNGTVGRDRQSMKPKSFAQVVSFQPISSEIELVMQVSNFSQRKGGMWSPLLFGDEQAILKQREHTVIQEVITASSILTLSFYHLSLYIYRVTTLLPLFLSILCFLVSLRTLLVGDILFMYVFPNFSWEWSVKIEYLTFYGGLMIVFLFFHHLFPQETNKKLARFTILICTLFIATTLLPARIFTHFLLLFEIWLIFMFAYLLYIVSMAAKRKREGSYILFLSIFALILAVINDVLFYNQWIQTIDLAPIAASIFLVVQTLIVAKKSSNAFKREEILSIELMKTNASLEQKVAERTKDLQDKNSQLRHIEKTRKAFFTSIAHEIGTPMQSIQGYVQLMQSKASSKEMQHYLDIIYKKTKLFNALSKDLLDLAKLDEGQLEFHFEPINVAFFLDHIEKQLQYDIEKEGIHFVLANLDENETAIFAQMDIMRMEQVFINLVQNASKFTPSNGTIFISAVFITHNEDTQNGSLVIQVKDNGQGIDADLLPHVFKRFIKGKIQPKIKKGSGLGLAISMEIIKRHKGSITVESEEGKGSTFSITLPAYSVKGDTKFD